MVGQDAGEGDFVFRLYECLYGAFWQHIKRFVGNAATSINPRLLKRCINFDF